MIRNRLRLLAFLFVVICSCLGATASAQIKIEGFITARNGPEMTVQTADNLKYHVLLTDDTRVGQVQGVFKARKKQMSMAALVPGLVVKVDGTYNEQHQIVAGEISFKGNDLKNAQAVQAGMQQTKADMAVQKAALKEQEEALAAEQKKVAANKAAIEAANRRFGQLDDYNILGEVTVYFANGKTRLEQPYELPLLDLARQAKTVNAYMIQVKGYASSVGSVEMNQKLSEERARNVVNFLLQQGQIPLTNLLAPGAMGESEQVGNEKSANDQARSRRVVVRILQNKGIAGQ